MRGERRRAETGPEADLHFEMGGPADPCIMQRIGLIKGPARPSLAEASASPPSRGFQCPSLQPRKGMRSAPRRDPPCRSTTQLTPACSSLGVLIFAAEAVVGPRLRAAGLRFTRAGIIRSASIKEFGAAVARVRRRWEAALRGIATQARTLPPCPCEGGRNGMTQKKPRNWRLARSRFRKIIKVNNEGRPPSISPRPVAGSAASARGCGQPLCRSAPLTRTGCGVSRGFLTRRSPKRGAVW